MDERINEPCPVCSGVGGYCGGSGHPSCGSFVNGNAVSEAEFQKLHAKEEPKAG